MDAKETTWQEPEKESTKTFEAIKAKLTQNKVKFDVTEHKAVRTCEEAAQVRKVTVDSGAKAMLIKDSGKKLAKENVPYYLAVMSASKRFSNKAFKKMINCKNIKFASEEECYKITGCLTGAVPPFGSVFSVPVWVDRSLSKEKEINFNAGLRTHSISMSYEDYFKVEAPTFHVFTEEEITLGDLPVEAAKGGDQPKNQRDAAKAERLAKRQKKVQEQVEDNVKDPKDISAALFGERELNRSQGDPELRFKKVIDNIQDIDEGKEGKDVVIRGRLHNSRGQGAKLAFLVIRQQYSTVQCVIAADEKIISKGMVGYSVKVPNESIVEIKAKVIKPKVPVQACTQKIELEVQEFWVLNKSAPILPFQIDVASRLVTNQAAEDAGVEEHKEGEESMAVVTQKTRLDNRIIDLRVPTNQAIFKLQSGVCRLYREFMMKNDFVEIHSPKMIAGASEGGANVFKMQYFGQEACLAQSPQLYKQMALCADFDRVFEIGPVFRAEDSNTNRHLCEFTGLDMEMTIKEHYFEVLDMLADLLVFIFNGIETRYAKELEVIKQQYPFEDFKCKSPVVKLHFKDGVKMLHKAGIEQGPLDDLSTESEKALGKLVKEKYDTDFYMLYGYPSAVRPFYTMLDPHDPDYTNSYDFFMRGEEITSGAQRIHDPDMLTTRAKHFEIPVGSIQDYIDSFKYGAPAHGGAGFGLERIVKFYCNLHNIRKSSLFPRDPKRIKP